MSLKITDADVNRIASRMQVNEPLLQAILKKESRGAGFLPPPDNRPKILFEGHWFYRLAPKEARDKALIEAPSICYPTWTREHYAKGPNALARMKGEWDRLALAIKYHRNAALQSASWGLGQVMGMHWQRVGYESIQSFVNAMYGSEALQFEAVVKFMQANKSLNTILQKQALSEQDFHTVGRLYNGSLYQKNNYHTDLRTYYLQAGGIVLPSLN
jgi:hypothetical protein